MKFEYVISAPLMTRIPKSQFTAFPECINAANAYITQQNKQAPYLVSCLFNGFTESSLGPTFSAHYNKSFHNIFVDSGGLQVVTVGKTVTPEIKESVYTIQALHGSVGMCFDEIPVKILNSDSGKKSQNRTSLTNKVYVTDDAIAKAKLTGQNVNNQLRKYKELNSDCKAMLIVQGNCAQDYVDWVHAAYEEIDEELRPSIHGLALANSSLGIGIRESVEMCSAFGKIDIEHLKHNIHFLGMGSFRRMIPIMELCRSGYFPDTTNISFDSSSHSSKMMMGTFTDKNNKQIDIGKKWSIKNEQVFGDIYDDIIKYFKTDIDKETYVKHIVTNISDGKNLRSSQSFESIAELTYFVYCMHCVNNFMNAIMDCMQDPNNYYKILDTRKSDIGNMLKVLLSLSTVKNNSDMDAWISGYSKFLPSKRIKRIKNLNSYQEINLFDFL